MLRRMLLVCGLAAAVVGLAAASGATARKPAPQAGLAGINHIVVIYQENHSFDNLLGLWEGVNGLRTTDYLRTLQVTQGGAPYSCLKQNELNLLAPSGGGTCQDMTGATPFWSMFTNAPFLLDGTFSPATKTCPAPGVFAANGIVAGSGLAGGCTEDIVHRFYQEQYQIHGGAMDRYATGSDAMGLVMGVYNTYNLPIYEYLHSKGHPRYAIEDDFFQGAFGGSFLNHQWLIAARTPVWATALNDGSANDLHSVVDANGMPNNYGLYVSPLGTATKDQALTASFSPGAGRAPTPGNVLCGNYAVNTIQPTYQPFSPGTAAARQLPPLTTPTIGDALSAKKIDWAWYAGGWSNANGDVGGPGWTNGTAGLPANATSSAPCSDAYAAPKAVWPNCPDLDFQFHHQPFNYYATFDPSTDAGKANRKAHLKDEAEFVAAANASKSSCKLKAVSFIKPIGEENEHPGYASESVGNQHLVDLLKSIEGSACAKDTLVVATYDEFGGQWDHVPPPGQGAVPGPHDAFGPGTRIPAFVIAPGLRSSFVVDHAEHDTVSILTTIEHRFGLKPLGKRDAADNDLATAFAATAPVLR